MKLKNLLTTLLLLAVGGFASAAITSGYYRVISYNSKYLTENTSSHSLICSDLIDGNYSQVWYLNVNGTNVTFKNVLTDRYIQGQGTFSQQYSTGANNQSFAIGETENIYTFQYDSYNNGGLHCDNSNVVVEWYVSDDKSKWTIEAADVDASALAAQKAAISEASTTDLLKVFTTTACTELKGSYSESDLTALPSTVQAMAAKIKNNTWATYSGWDKTEKTFRIADYKAYSSHTRWTNIIGLGYSFGRLTNPTGISVTAGDYIQVYVGEIPSGQSVRLEVAGQYQAAGTTYALEQGMNVLLMASSGNCFVQYEVDNTMSGSAPYTALSSYADVTVHIEGGTVNGYFDLTKGDDNEDWAKLQANLLTGTSVDIKTSNLLFHMNTGLVKAACPSNMVELLGEWDKILDMEHSLMGLESFDGYWNNLLSVTDMSGQDYMHASTYGTYYDVETLSSIMSYENMFAGGALWGPAHENGHIFQKYINMVGQTEVSNNVFSNVAVYNNGHLTSRATNISVTFENMANNKFWNDRDIWERTHLYFQLYQFFHILGNDPDFYPELFKAFRSDPMVHEGNTFISATDDYLKFYKKCCQISGYDLTEFFQAYGFFVIPTLTSYTLNSVTKDAYQIGDYGDYYLTVTQDEINAAKQAVADMNLPKANIIFIEDRITAPDATYEGASGAKKTAFSNEYPIGQAGETGQYTDFGATCSAYKYNVTGSTVTMEGTGAVGFKVYDSTGNLRGLYNTYSFTLPDGIGTDYTIKAAAGNGTDAAATFDASVGVIVSDVTDVISVDAGAKITAESQLVSGNVYLLRNMATGNPWITDAGTYYSVPNGGGTLDTYCMYYLIKDGNDTWKIKNYSTGKYWGKPTAASTTNQGGFVPTDEAGAGSWTLNFNSDGNIDPQCNGFHINRASQKLHAWSTALLSQIYEVAITYPSLSEFDGKDIRVSSDAAASLQTNQWYVMFDRGPGHGYLYENNSNELYNTATVPSGSASDNAKYLVRIVGWNNEYYLQTGLGNFFGKIQQSTVVPTTTTATEQITIKKIADTDGHFYLMSADGVVLDANSLTQGDGTVVGWGSTAPTTTGGNNDWAFYPVEFVDSWIPTISELYTINNTNTSRGAMMYNGTSSYVWSSGKSGTFSATDPNCQWVLVPTGTDKQYYLYNVGAGKFAIPSGTNSTASWVFSNNAVAITLLKQTDGTFKIKTVTTDTYAAVSNGYAGPIINYNDIGGNFTITKVDGDQSTAATVAFNKLADNVTPLTAVPASGSDGWYIIRINQHGTYADKYVYPAVSEITYNGTNYPLTFEHGANVRPSISDVTYFTRISNDNNTYYWQLPNGKFLYGNNNKFPISTTTKSNFAMDYTSGKGFRMWGSSRYAVPYLLNSQYFIGETSSSGNAYYDIYPVDLAAAGLTVWQVLCDNAPETAQISCTRSDVCGLTTVYKNGYIFLPASVTPESSDFVLDGAIDATVDANAKTVSLNYNPDLAIVEGGVIVVQGWQTAGRDSEVMLLKVTASPFKDATGVSLTASLKDGSENQISSLKLYEASTSSPEIYSTGDGAPTKTVVATATISGSTATFSIGNLSAGNHYYWIGAAVKSDAALGAVLDAAVTSITYTCNSKETTLDLTAVGDPADRGAMVFNAHSYPFLPRDNGSRVYRIPAMVVAEDGSIVVAADKRYQSHTDIGNGGHVIDIVVRRSTDGGKTWSAPVTIAKGEGSTASGGDDKRCGFGDPSLVKGKDGKLYCLFAAGNEGYFYGQKGMCMSVSTDNGVTWSSGEGNPPVDLYWSGAIKNVATAGAAGFGLYDYFVTSGRGLYIPEDDILMYLIPAQTMTSATEHTGDSQDYVFYSRDGGESWYFSETPMVQGGDEAKIIQMNDGSLFGSIRKGGNRRFNTATYTCNDDGKTLNFNFGTQWDNSQLTQSSQNNQDILYYQRETVTGKKDYIFHSITTGNHTNFELYYSTDKGLNWTKFLTVQTKGTRYVTMDKSGTDENPGSLYLFFEDQSLNSAGGYTDYNHYPLNFIEITREQLLQYIPDLEKSAQEKNVKIVYGTTAHTTYGSLKDLTWTSNEASGVEGLTMVASDGAFNQFSNWNSHYNIAYQPATANTDATLTLTAPEGYVIAGYSMLVARASSTAHTYTVTTAAGTSTDVPFGSNASSYATVSQSNINTASTTITINTNDASKWLAIADFVVTLIPAEYPINLTAINNKSYATTYLPFGITLPDDVTAYKIGVSGDYAIPTSMGQELPANTPALLISETGVTNATATVNGAASADASGNVLVGTTSAGYIDGYVLNAVDNQIGFYKLSSTGSLAANRAYIPSSIVVGNQIKAFLLPDGTETGISQTAVPENEETYYSLSGVKVKGKPTVKGVFIQPGRKVVVN